MLYTFILLYQTMKWICFKTFSNHSQTFSREIKRYHLDKEILRLDIEATELSGTIADRRRAISKSRNQKLLKVRFIYHFFHSSPNYNYF